MVQIKNHFLFYTLAACFKTGNFVRADEKQNLRQQRQRNLQNDNIFDLGEDQIIRKMTKPCTLLLKEALNETDANEQVWECELHRDDSQYGLSFGHIIPIKGKHHWNVGSGTQVNGKEFESGITTLFDIDAEIVQNTLILKGNQIFGRKNVLGEDDGHHRHLNEPEPIIGTRNVLVVHVTAQDTKTSASPERLSDKIFGLYGDVDNLVSGYNQCSHGQLKFVPAEHPLATNGVHQVTFNNNIVGLSELQVRTRVLAKLERKMGYLPDLFSHVMLCLPPGTSGEWIGYGFLNHFTTSFNDGYCSAVSTQMHEIGHNLGLSHSNEPFKAYADSSGRMGWSNAKDEGHLACFNNAKNWQLGWYRDQSVTVEPYLESWRGKLVGMVDYGIEGHKDKEVVVRIHGSTDGVDYYFGLNRAKGMHKSTSKGKNLITVQSKSGDPYKPGESSLLATLKSGQKYTIVNFKDGQPANIQFNSLSNELEPWIADTTVFLGCEADSDCDDNNPCTDPTCDITTGFCSFNDTMICAGEKLSFELQTDEYPEETSWTLTDVCTGRMVGSGSGYMQRNTLIKESMLIESLMSRYRLTVRDEMEDGICCGYGDGFYRITVGDSEVLRGGTFSASETKYFGALSCDIFPTQTPSTAPTLAPITPSPTLAPVTPAPTLAPVTPAPTLAPVTPEPTTLAPVTPEPTTLAPVTPAPTTRAPVTPEPTTLAPVTPEPTTLAPATPAPTTLAPATPVPTTPFPTTLAPVTPVPTAPATNTPANPEILPTTALLPPPSSPSPSPPPTYLQRPRGTGTRERVFNFILAYAWL